MKKLLTFFLSVCALAWFVVFADTLSIDPLYSDERFPPTDKLHAWCVHTADIKLSTDADVVDVHVVLEYDSELIDVLRVMPDSKNKEEIIDFSLSEWMIEYHHENMIYIPWYNIKLFGIMLNSSDMVERLDVSFASGSYAVLRDGWIVDLQGTQTIDFVSVPECDPDIVPPTIRLVKPAVGSWGVALDALFVFEMKDKWKWIDPDSIYITIDKDVYTATTPGVMYSWDFVVIQPINWLPVDEDVAVLARVSDLQRYGGANTMKKHFVINTAKWVQLDSGITPLQLQKQAREIESGRWDLQECILLQSMVGLMNEGNQDMINNVFEKLDCEMVIANVDSEHLAAQGVTIIQKQWISIFAITGWVLFILTLILKLHYFIAYKKHLYNTNK